MPIIIYHGKRKWIIKPFSSYFGDVDEEFHRFIDPCDYYLTNLQDYSDEMIHTFTNMFLMKSFLALKHHTDKQYIRSHYVVLAFVGINKNNSKEELDFAKYFFVYLSSISGGITKREIFNQVEQIEDNLTKENMKNFIEELKEEGIEIGIEKGIEKGIERGIERGIEQGKKISIYQVYLAGFDVEALSRIFALPSTEILQIIEEVKKMEQAKDNN